MRMADADDLVAVDVFNAAQATGEPVTTALVRRVVDDLLTHPSACGCGRCEAAATARVGDVRNIASSWQRAVATKTTRNPLNRPRVGSEVHLLNNQVSPLLAFFAPEGEGRGVGGSRWGPPPQEN
jgi:hypothetical protein